MADRREHMGDFTVLCPPLTRISRAYAGGAPVLVGDIAQMPLLSLFNILTQGRETGRLLLRRERIERVVLLREGDLGAMGGNGPADKLGATLLRSGRVTRGQFDQALAAGKQAGIRVGQALIDMGVLQPHELFDVIREQVTEMFCDCASWSTGSFFLYRLPDGFRFPPAPPVSLTGLVLEAARRADELALVRSQIGDDETPIVLTGKVLDGDEGLQAAHLVYAQLGEPPLSVGELTRRTRLSAFDCLRGIQRLIQCQVAQIACDDTPGAGPEDVAPVTLTDEQRADIDCVRLGFREIEQALAIGDHTDAFRAGIERYLGHADAHTKTLLEDIDEPTVHLDAHQLTLNIARLPGPQRVSQAQACLVELLKFAAFQAGELLSPVFEIALTDRLRSVCGRLMF